MKIYSRHNSKNTGELSILTSWMLISPQNSQAKNISIQISEIPPGSQQPVHKHEPEQCYYIVGGKGLMTIEDQSQEVAKGDAVYIPSNLNHGLKNTGDDVLEYLTANAPVFSEKYENTLWPSPPA